MADDETAADSKHQLRMSEYLSMERRLAESEKRIEELEAELESWHQRGLEATHPDASPEELRHVIADERLNALTHHLRAEHAKRLEAEKRLKATERHLYKYTHFPGESAENGSVATSDDSDAATDEIILKHQQAIHDMLRESEQYARTVDVDADHIPAKPFAGEDLSEADLEDVIPDTPPVSAPASQVRTPVRTDALRPPPADPATPNDDLRPFIQLMMRMGVVHQSDAALLLNKSRPVVAAQAEQLKRQGYIAIEDAKSKDPTYRVTKTLKKKMLDIRSQGRRRGR